MRALSTALPSPAWSSSRRPSLRRRNEARPGEVAHAIAMFPRSCSTTSRRSSAHCSLSSRYTKLSPSSGTAPRRQAPPSLPPIGRRCLMLFVGVLALPTARRHRSDPPPSDVCPQYHSHEVQILYWKYYLIETYIWAIYTCSMSR